MENNPYRGFESLFLRQSRRPLVGRFFFSPWPSKPRPRRAPRAPSAAFFPLPLARFTHSAHSALPRPLRPSPPCRHPRAVTGRRRRFDAPKFRDADASTRRPSSRRPSRRRQRALARGPARPFSPSPPDCRHPPSSPEPRPASIVLGGVGAAQSFFACARRRALTPPGLPDVLLSRASSGKASLRMGGKSVMIGRVGARPGACARGPP